MVSVQIKTVLPQTASIVKNARLDVRQALQAITDKQADKQADKEARERQESTKVTLSASGRSQGKLLQMQQSINSVSAARKSAARAHAAQIQQQIEALKKIAVMLGPLASKTILRQIKHLAQQLRQIAAELAQSSSAPATSSPEAAAGNAVAEGGNLSVNADVDSGVGEEVENGEGKGEAKSESTEAIARDDEAARTKTPEAESAEGKEEEAKGEAAAVLAQAEQAVHAAEEEVRENEKSGESGKTTGMSSGLGTSSEARDAARQKQEDAQLVRSLAKELRLLLNLAKATLLKKDKEDKENLKEIDRQFADIDALARELEAAAQSVAEAPTVDAAVGEAVASISVFA
jgi:hypothetical protein